MGNERLVAGDLPAAFEYFKASAADAPIPIPDELFNDALSKFAANLYFRGGRDEGVMIARMIEPKADTNAAQLLIIAGFFMSVENGTDAKRLAEKALVLEPNSATAYQTLGLANRIDFKLDDSAAAFARALEIEPDSLTARRGLAEMKRSLGRSDEAVTLYREILAKDGTNIPAQTGLILALFEAGKRPDAETELARSLEANPGNVVLLAGTAYWYAAHEENDKAIDYAQKAIAADPRFIWSHIALARGQLNKKDPIAAEKTLLAARMYGNFPTLEYELASARVASGFYREAAEELAKSFSISNGVIHTNLGGRVPRESKDFTDIVSYERRASIFAPTAADSPENATKLTALLELRSELDSANPRPDIVANAADNFVKGDDKMKVHRQIFAATQMLEKRVALPKVIELSRAATANIDAGLDVQNPSIAVMAGELYESRAIAAVQGRYISVPDVPRLTLGTILRGQIEELSGWAAFQMDDPAAAVVRLKRAISVLPADSAWWRSSTWRLGAALERTGSDAEALDMYIKSYRSNGGPNAISYGVIENLYKKIKGNTDGLGDKIGPKPTALVPTQTVAKITEPTAEAKIEPAPVPAPTTDDSIKPTPKIDLPPGVPVRIEPVSTPEIKADPTPDTTVKDVPRNPEIPSSVPVATPETVKAETTSKPVAIPATLPTADETKAAATPDAMPKATLETSPEVQKTPEEKPASTSPANTSKELFPTVVITIPPPGAAKTTAVEPDTKSDPEPTRIAEKPIAEPKLTPSDTPTPAPTQTPETKPGENTVASDSRPRIVETKPELKPCKLTASEESIAIQTGGSDLAVIVGLEDDGDLTGLTAVSSSPQDVAVRRETIAGVNARALFVVRSVSTKVGMYQVTFELPCGKKEIFVKVR